jgi:hypothetical protein
MVDGVELEDRGGSEGIDASSEGIAVVVMAGRRRKLGGGSIRFLRKKELKK